MCGCRSRSVPFSIIRAPFDHAAGVDRRSSSSGKGANWDGRATWALLPPSDMGAGRKSSRRGKGAVAFGSGKGAYLLLPDIRGNIGADRSSSSRVKGANWDGRGGGPPGKLGSVAVYLLVSG